MRSGAADGDPDPILPRTAKRFLPPRQATASFSGGRQSPRQAGLSPRGRRRLFLTINGPSRLRLPAGGCGAALPGRGGPAGRRAALSRTPGGDAGGASIPPLGPFPRGRRAASPAAAETLSARPPFPSGAPRPCCPRFPAPPPSGLSLVPRRGCAKLVESLCIAGEKAVNRPVFPFAGPLGFSTFLSTFSQSRFHSSNNGNLFQLKLWGKFPLFPLFFPAGFSCRDAAFPRFCTLSTPSTTTTIFLFFLFLLSKACARKKRGREILLPPRPRRLWRTATHPQTATHQKGGTLL